jgi:uncharacterized protein YdeI (YjbR/CyaY-like superfamily)
MLRSTKFEVTISGTHHITIPSNEAKPFLEKRHKRVALTTFFENKKVSFHGKLHQRKNAIHISFGKRNQKELGINPSDFFELQILEDTTTYGVTMPEELKVVLETDAKAFSLFRKLTDGKKRSLIYYIIRFENTQTRVDKALMICENLKLGITELKELVKKQR